MVYCGKPSKGCAACRQKKTRCDKLTPSCSQCIRANRTCPGYRNQLDLMFRSENEVVKGKSQVRETPKAKSKSPTPTYPPTPTPTPSNSLVVQSIEDFDRRTLETEVARFSRYYIEHQGSFARSVAPSVTIAPTLEERARGYFSSNSSTWLRNFDLVDELCGQGQTQEDDPLLACMGAVGLASFANSVHATELVTRARMDYVKALRLTNAALRSPTEVRKDSTLFAVMILSIFEIVAGSNEHSLEAWAEHVHGAGALLKIRGPTQFRTRAGQRLFMQVVSNLMISCLQRTLPIPDHIMELLIISKKYIDTSAFPVWRVSEVIFDFTKFRAAARDCDIVGTEAVIERAMEIDRRFMEVFKEAPPSWTYRTTYTDDNPDFVWNRRYDVYADNTSAPIWNGMRCCRILLHEMIRDQLLASSMALTPIFSEDETSEQYNESVRIILEMQADILASIPQHTPFSLNDRSSNLMEAARGYSVLWPLYMIGVMDLTTQPIREWVIRRMRSIGDYVCIRQAHMLAEFLEQHRPIWAWDTKPTPRLRKDGDVVEWVPATGAGSVLPDVWDNDATVVEAVL